MVFRSKLNLLTGTMMKRISIYKTLIISTVSAILLASCTKDFLEKYPSGTLVESNAFLTYDNYKAYMYQCYSLCACPKCGTGRMRFYGKVVRCDNTECGLPVFRLKAGRTLSDDEIKDLLTEGHTKLLKGFKSKQGKSFDAVVAFDGEYNTTFVFPEAKKDKKFSGRKK